MVYAVYSNGLIQPKVAAEKPEEKGAGAKKKKQESDSAALRCPVLPHRLVDSGSPASARPQAP